MKFHEFGENAATNIHCIFIDECETYNIFGPANNCCTLLLVVHVTSAWDGIDYK